MGFSTNSVTKVEYQNPSYTRNLKRCPNQSSYECLNWWDQNGCTNTLYQNQLRKLSLSLTKLQIGLQSTLKKFQQKNLQRNQQRRTGGDRGPMTISDLNLVWWAEN